MDIIDIALIITTIITILVCIYLIVALQRR